MREIWVKVFVSPSVLFPKVPVHLRSSIRRELAVKNNYKVRLRLSVRKFTVSGSFRSFFVQAAVSLLFVTCTLSFGFSLTVDLKDFFFFPFKFFGLWGKGSQKLTSTFFVLLLNRYWEEWGNVSSAEIFKRSEDFFRRAPTFVESWNNLSGVLALERIGQSVFMLRNFKRPA